MANEIAANIALRFSKEGATSSIQDNFNATMAGNEFVQKSQEIATTATVVGFGNISSAPSFVAVKNLDPVNFVEFGDETLSGFKLRLGPGHSMMISPSSATLYAKADTDPVRIQLLALDA